MSRQALDTPTSENLRPQAVVADKYRLESLLAEGGMGSVWVATNLVLEKPVAIKVLHANMRNDLAEARLLREARAAAQIGHSNIVQVFDFGHLHTGEPFIVMELLRGEDLGARLTRVGRLAAIEAVKLVLPVTSALAAGHAKGIVHRDMKPGNIFIAEDDFGNETPKVVDFGIAKVQTPRHTPKLTMEGRVVGSPEYLSPEQARGDDDLDATTDVWALCVTLYESVTGDLPFHDENYNRLLRHIIEEQPRPITDYAAGDAALWSIISRGLTKHRRGRWPSMEELGRALEGWLQSHGVNDIPRVRFSSLSGVDGEPFSSRTPTRRSDTSDDNDDDAEATLLRVPPPVPGPAPSTAGPKLVVPLPTIIHSKPKPPVSAGTSPVPIPVRMDASPSRVEAPPVYGDTRTTGISFGRLQLGPLKLALLVMGGLAVGGVAVALIVVMLQNVTSPSSTETGSPVIPTTSSDFERESPHLLPQDPTQGITDPPVPSPLPPASAEPPPETSATSPPTVIQRQPRPSKTRPPPIPTAPNF